MRLILGVLLLLSGATAFAQDARVTPEDRTPRRVATTGYTLALSWAPEYCQRRRGDAECALPSAQGFTLHGLWPDGADPKVWPQYCHVGGALTPAELRAGEGATPSPRLLQHEWDKHGSCMSANPAAYFAEEARLYRTIRFPDMAALARRRDLTTGTMTRAFAAANPGVTPAMVRLNLNRHGWLEEVWLCLGPDKRPRACPAGVETPSPATRVRVQAPA
ncbi:ribonuclease T2 family protein [Sphingomonas sp.]|uniref:ribonuclease T2 family protein n=1 Tax=Sphingomonas sp. TaxID=28214 RepID=UPI003AFF700A